MTLCSCQHDKADSGVFWFYFFLFIQNWQGPAPLAKKSSVFACTAASRNKAPPPTPLTVQSSVAEPANRNLLKFTFLFFWLYVPPCRGHGAMRQKEAFKPLTTSGQPTPGLLCKADGPPFYFNEFSVPGNFLQVLHVVHTGLGSSPLPPPCAPIQQQRAWLS